MNTAMTQTHTIAPTSHHASVVSMPNAKVSETTKMNGTGSSSIMMTFVMATWMFTTSLIVRVTIEAVPNRRKSKTDRSSDLT
ncbi:hypothetical protein PG1612B_1086 [Bifidobacterium pseudolongum subsp. pseudolongum]|nr:hypothetical protein PG1612B_1086 [Bifidobacterium pseudolongum subsp. pseudolongum]